MLYLSFTSVSCTSLAWLQSHPPTMFGLDWGLRIVHLADQEKVVEELQECEDEGQIFLAVDKVPKMRGRSF